MSLQIEAAVNVCFGGSAVELHMLYYKHTKELKRAKKLHHKSGHHGHYNGSPLKNWQGAENT